LPCENEDFFDQVGDLGQELADAQSRLAIVVDREEAVERGFQQVAYNKWHEH
jgi:hypothetical protein